MRKFTLYFLVLLSITASCCKKELLPISTQPINIIPKPVIVERARGEFIFTPTTSFEFDNNSKELTNIVRIFNSKVKVPFGFEISTEMKSGNKISLVIDSELANNEFSRNKLANTDLLDDKPNHNKLTDNKPNHNKLTDNKPNRNKLTDNKPNHNKLTDNKLNNNKLTNKSEVYFIDIQPNQITIRASVQNPQE